MTITPHVILYSILIKTADHLPDARQAVAEAIKSLDVVQGDGYRDDGVSTDVEIVSVSCVIDTPAQRAQAAVRASQPGKSTRRVQDRLVVIGVPKKRAEAIKRQILSAVER